jgi:hypothetical protein
MNRPLRFLGLLALLGVLIAGGWAWQQRTTTALRDELDRRKRAAAEDGNLKAEHAGLLGRQVPPEEMARRRAEHEAWTHLAGEIATLQSRLEAKKPAAAPNPPTARARSLKEASLTMGEWRNLGQENPAAAFETVLWAAASGEVAELAAGLEMDAATRGKAAAIFNRLPPALQREVGTPEQLVALLTARDVPLGTAWILGQFGMRPDETRVMAQLGDSEGTKRDVLFILREREGRWRLVVPPQVMTKYAAFLKGEPAEPPVP